MSFLYGLLEKLVAPVVVKIISETLSEGKKEKRVYKKRTKVPSEFERDQNKTRKRLILGNIVSSK
jgi:hypothetical protein